MKDIQDEMRRAKDDASRQNGHEMQQKQMLEQTVENARQTMKRLLHQIADDLVSGDNNLNVLEIDATGFQIHYILVGKHNPTPFSVGVTYNGGEVELQVADGTWENMPNVSGNWGHWSDAKVMYAGSVTPAKIRDVVTRSFLNWYKSSVH